MGRRSLHAGQAVIMEQVSKKARRMFCRGAAHEWGGQQATLNAIEHLGYEQTDTTRSSSGPTTMSCGHATGIPG
jgi:hypothetical protein